MNDPKPDIMDGCGVSFWVIISLVLLLVIPLGVRNCSDSKDGSPVDQLELEQRIRKIEEAALEEDALRQRLTITLDEAMQRALSNYTASAGEENNATKKSTGEHDDGGEEPK